MGESEGGLEGITIEVDVKTTTTVVSAGCGEAMMEER